MGLAQGKRELLCELIQKKVQKGKTTEEIAEELEEPQEVIEKFCKI